MTSWLTWLVIVLGGIASAVQPPINAKLATYIRAIPASLVSFLVGGAVLLVVTLFTLRGQGGLAGLTSGLAAAPPWSFLGGLAGAVLVTAIVIGTGQFGTYTTLSVLTAVQLAAALVIDTFGFGLTQRLPLGWPQVVGLLLIVGGVRLVLWR